MNRKIIIQQKPRAKLEMAVIFWTALLLAGIGFWFYVTAKTEIDYSRHPQLVDTANGIKFKPKDLLELGKIISRSESYINSTNAEERLYELEYMMDFENPFRIDQVYSRKEDLIKSGWPVANKNVCGQQLNWILNKLAEHKDYTLLRGALGYELTNYMDSFGRAEAAVYSGLVVWPGSYKLCVQSNLDGGRIKTGRYCYAKFKPKWWPKNERANPATTIRIGVCLPETCDTLSFNYYNSSIEYLAKLNLPDYYKKNLDFHSLFCLPDERSPIRQMPFSGYIYLYILIAWLMLVLLGTILHEILFKRKNKGDKTIQKVLKADGIQIELSNLQSNEKKPELKSLVEDLLEALSIRFSLNSFKTNAFKVRYNQGHRVRVNLGAMDFFKFGMTLLVILGHSGYLTLIYTRTLQNRVHFNTLDISRLALSVSRCVDTFFVFFGVLTSFTLMRKLNLKQMSNPLFWMGINFGIFFKITPVFMIIYWYSKVISPYTGSGPWWDYGVDRLSMKGVCLSEAWWKSIPYFGSFGMVAAPTCVLPGWFLVSYAQLSLLLPLITYLICKMPNYIYRFVLAGLLVIVSAASIGIKLNNQTSVRDEGLATYGTFLIDLLEKFESTGYMSSLGRLGSVTMGCLVGYLLKLYEDGKIINWPNWLRSNLTVAISSSLSIIIFLLPMVGDKFGMVTLNEFVWSNAIVIVVYPILISVLTLNLTTVNNHKVTVRFFAHSFFHVFNRLGLIIFLIHWEIIFIALTNFEQAPSYGFFTDIFKVWTFGTVLSIAFALVIHILIEAPLGRFLMILVERTKPSR